MDYIDYWAEEMNLNSIQKQMIDLYATISCVDFISELGQQFNSDENLEIDFQRAEKLHLIYQNLMQII